MSVDTLLLASYGALWVIVVVQSLVILELLRQVGLIARRLGPEPGALLDDDGLQRGSVAPAIDGLDLFSGRRVQSVQNDSRGDRPTLLVFLSPRCGACRDLAAELPEFARDFEDQAVVLTVCSGRREECIGLAKSTGIRSNYVLDEDQSITQRYRALRTPSAVLVGTDGLVRLHATPNHWRHLEALLREEATPMHSRAWLRTADGDAATATALTKKAEGV